MLTAQREEYGTPEHISSLVRASIRPHLPRFAACRSSVELGTVPAYQSIQTELNTVLHTVQTGSFVPHSYPAKPHYRMLAWNIERGKELAGQIEAFRMTPYLRDCDVLLLTETDVGMARSGNIDVARTLAEELGYDYAFAPCYLSLVKGSGTERDVEGENDIGLHGNAILSRYPILNTRRIALRNGIDKMASNEKRLGTQCAVAAVIDFPGSPLPVASVHLDANSTQQHRADQIRDILDALPSSGPALIGGDWNTTTFNSSTAFHAIMGYCLRVLMGPGNVIRNHYLHPDRWFERNLFRLLEQRGYDYRNSNQIGVHTIFYEVKDIRTHKGLAEWIPGWCFPFIRWALREHGGGCPLKIDWFAARGLECHDPCVLHEIRKKTTPPLSDHDPIGVDIRFP
jgi:endonuclease/exonuclease/phosphatase family metal-dependent hydrolase